MRLPASHSPLLHVTNGDHAAEKIKTSGVLGDVLAWRDALHEGPVPAGVSNDEMRRVRAGFISEQGWLTVQAALVELEARDRLIEEVERSDEIVLWFEHDLYDQLQLLQVLDMLAARDERPQISLAQSDTYLGELDTPSLHALYAERRDVGARDLKYAIKAWTAFRAEDPRDLVKLSRKDSPFPFVPTALARHLEEFPHVRDGLSRTERQILAAAVAEPTALARVFERQNACEEAMFLADAAFLIHARRLLAEPVPLLRLLSREPLGDPSEFPTHAEFWDRAVTLTPAGEEVLAGKRDWLAEQGIDRWLGGVHLTRAAYWRWDPEKKRLTKAAS